MCAEEAEDKAYYAAPEILFRQPDSSLPKPLYYIFSY